MAQSLFLFGENQKAGHVLHRQQGCQAAPSDRVLKTHPSSTGERAIGRRRLQLSDNQPSPASKNGKVLKHTH